MAKWNVYCADPVTGHQLAVFTVEARSREEAMMQILDKYFVDIEYICRADDK